MKYTVKTKKEQWNNAEASGRRKHWICLKGSYKICMVVKNTGKYIIQILWYSQNSSRSLILHKYPVVIAISSLTSLVVVLFCYYYALNKKCYLVILASVYSVIEKASLEVKSWEPLIYRMLQHSGDWLTKLTNGWIFFRSLNCSVHNLPEQPLSQNFYRR